MRFRLSASLQKIKKISLFSKDKRISNITKRKLSFRNLSLSKKLLTGFMAVNVLLIGIGMTSIQNIYTVQKNANEVIDNQFNSLNSLSTMSSEIHSLQESLLLSAQSNDSKSFKSIDQSITKIENQILNQLRISGSLIQNQNKELWDQFVSGLNDSFYSITNDFSNIEDSKMYAKDSTTHNAIQLTSIAKVNKSISELDTLMQIETKKADETKNISKALFRKTLIVTIGIIIFSLIISIALSLFIIRMIKKPINEVTNEMKNIANSNGNLTKRLEFNTNDEIGQLSLSFNGMMANIQGIIQLVAENTDQVASTSEQLSASTNQMIQVSEEISQATQEISAGAEQQLSSVNITSQSIFVVVDQISQLRQNTYEIHSSSAKAKESVEDGNQTIQNVANEMKSIVEYLEQLGQRIQSLNQHAKQIDSIVDIIREISSQSNLLALNATIEAARAGEHGLGFAVVADEVRKLSQQSNESALKIGQIIRKIQEDTKQTVENMHLVKSKVDTGLHAISISEKSFHTIHDAVKDVDHQIQNTLSGIETVNQGIAEISNSSNMVIAIAENSASNTQQVAASIQEQTSSISEIASSIQQLSNMAEVLKNVVNQFQY
ncbi:methyl-accepting chemotaxis protein [Fodinisporobacter ferrooxydans]|uniref:Methyl-accepting chemotaxis protein n=1 Tax=Fodinisporobacter ferrooxydans TaxID=2901836 RepID=A0ABY4CLJ7_9BACL|nr:methyl-accepting chemotaxis protein [Alicyclobacillaceae bacterium MYW30-H2]